MATDPKSADKPVVKPSEEKSAPPEVKTPVTGAAVKLASPKPLEKDESEYKVEELFNSEVLYFAPRRVVRLTFKEDHGDGKLVDGDKIDIAEYGMGDVKPLTNTIAMVLEALDRNNAISYADQGAVSGLNMHGLIQTISDANEEIMTLLAAACYETYSRDSKERKKMKQESFEDFSLGRLALILKTVWSVNWEHGFLKNVVRGLLQERTESSPSTTLSPSATTPASS